MKPRLLWTFPLLVSMLFLPACRTSPSSRPPAAEFQSDRTDLAQANKQIADLRSQNYDLSQQLDQARKDLARLQSAEANAFEFRPQKVVFGFLTAPVSWTDKPQYEGIQAYVYFQDQFGQSLRRASSFKLELYDVSQDTGRLIQTWTFTPEAAAQSWQSFLGGYLFKLPFDSGVPSSGKVLLKVVAKLTTDGSFEATRLLDLHLQRPLK